MEFVVCPTELARKAGAHISSLLSQHAGSPVLLLLSGGSALALLEHVDLTVNEGDTTVSVLDERYTSDMAGQNFVQVKQHLIDTPVQFFQPFPKSAQSVQEAARFFEAGLKNWRSLHPDGLIIATIGVGSDGHTAGIFPHESAEHFTERFEKTNQWVVGYDASSADAQYPARVTVSIPFLVEEVDMGVVYLSGKQQVQARLHDNVALHTMPSQILKRMQHITVFTNTMLIEEE